MLRFKDYIKEEEHIELDVNPEFALTQVDKINEDLDAVTANSFVNSALFINAVRGTLERYGIVLPAHSNMQQLALEGETVYALGDSGHYVYMVWDLDENHSVEGYATIANHEELDDLISLDGDEEEPVEVERIPRRLPPAARDDDSGNTNEYA